MSRCVVVLGMHRSGTSCVTRMLHHLGVYLGENYCTEPMPSNLIGHWEARDVVATNDEILSQSGGTWQNVPQRLTWNADCEMRIKQLLAQFAARPLFGWKDPRTTITFPAWQKHLLDYIVLACVRHPLAVAQSLEVRDGLGLQAGLRLWTMYNQHLLRHVSAAKHVFWFPYDQPQSFVQAHLRRLCDHLRLRWTSDTAALFNPYLCHGRAGDREIEGSETLALYHKLLGMSRASLGAEVDASAAPVSIVSEPQPGRAALEGSAAVMREKTLHEALQNLTAVQQLLTRRMLAMERAAGETSQRMAAIEDRLTRSIEYTSAVEQRLFDLQMSLPSTILRRWLGKIPGVRRAYHVVWRALATAARQLQTWARPPGKDSEADDRQAEVCA